jgi:hypothetical protein
VDSAVERVVASTVVAVAGSTVAAVDLMAVVDTIKKR